MVQPGQGREGEAAANTRQSKRATFNAAAALYQAARPDYPQALYDKLVEVTGIQTGDHLLEIGCATGKATIPLAERGFQITCVELGAELAAEAQRNLARFPQVLVHNSSFEQWAPPAGAAYDLVFAATAWAWLDPAVKYRKAWELLRPGGYLAFWDAYHVFPPGGDRFFLELDPVYQEIGLGKPPGAQPPKPGELPDRRAEIEATGLFNEASAIHFDWEIAYTAEAYIDLLKTFSDHIALADWQRDRLFGEIRRRLAERPDGLFRRHWGAVLNMARRVD